MCIWASKNFKLVLPRCLAESYENLGTAISQHQLLRNEKGPLITSADVPVMTSLAGYDVTGRMSNISTRHIKRTCRPTWKLLIKYSLCPVFNLALACPRGKVQWIKAAGAQTQT